MSVSVGVDNSSRSLIRSCATLHDQWRHVVDISLTFDTLFVARTATNSGGVILKGGPQLADRAETADHIHKDATDRYAPSLRALLLFARPIVTIGDFYYCVVLTILNVIPNGIICI